MAAAAHNPEREERHLSQVGMSKTKFPIWKADDDDDGAAAHSLTLSLSLSLPA